MLLVAAFVYDIEAGRRDAAVTRIRSFLEGWISLGLGYRMAPDGQRLFDPVEVINRFKWCGIQGLDEFWIDHFVAATRAFYCEWSSAESLRGFGRGKPARFAVDLRRRYDPTGIPPGQ